jgi:hypothetical protein
MVCLALRYLRLNEPGCIHQKIFLSTSSLQMTKENNTSQYLAVEFRVKAFGAKLICLEKTDEYHHYYH